jgi:adenine-specific DNA-methyltransferase
MELESSDVLAQKLEELKNILPEIFDDGVINIEKFKSIVAPQSDEKSEHYSFTWNGKKGCYQTIRQKSNATLKIDSSHSELDSESNSNVFIEGDNLEVLKLLQTSYHKKIKMIYIDPPYNKDKDFVYKDTWGDTITNYLIQTDQLREEGYTSTKTSSTGRRHTNWLNMIYPRLWLSRNLLRDDGVIFVSIDDDEVHNLRKVMDEIYGEENFEGHIHWRRRHNQPNDVTKMIGLVAEHILVYSKNKEAYKKSGVGKLGLTGDFSNPDDDPRGDWASKPWKTGSDQGGSSYEIITPTGKVYNEVWMGEEKTFKDLLKDNRIIFPKNGDGSPRKKYYKFEREEEGQSATNWWNHDQFGHNQEANDDMTSLFDGVKNIFSNPKSTKLIKNLIRLSNANENDIILDFFAGSGTTAHAVMELNKDDEKDGKKRNRKYILVQLPEATEENSEAYKAGYKKISDITKERIKRVIKKLDYKDGFKSYILDNSNFQIFKEVKKRPGESIESIEKMLKMSIFHENILTQGAKKLDIVYEIGLKNGFSLSANYEEFKKEKYSFIRLFEESREFFFTFDHKIANDIRECVPQGSKLICYDKSLDDSTKLNLRDYFALETL